MKKKIQKFKTVYIVATINGDHSIEWIYGTYTTENKAKIEITRLRKVGRAARCITSEVY